MEQENKKTILEAMLFASGREINISEIVSILDIDAKEVQDIVEILRSEYEKEQRGFEIIKVGEAYQMTTRKEYYDYLYPLFDDRAKPSLSAAAMETLSIIAYNPKITRAEIDAIRGVSSDTTIYKLLEYGLIEEGEKLNLPGKPRAYKTTNEFLKMFGISSLDELPELPRYKIDENEQIVIDDIIEEEAPMPEKGESKLNNENNDLKGSINK